MLRRKRKVLVIVMKNTVETTKVMAVTENNNLFKDYELIESVLDAVKDTVKIAIENKYNYDKTFMLAVIKYQQHNNGFYSSFVKDLEAIVNNFKEAIQYISRTEDLYFQEEYCLLDFNNFNDIKKFTTKYVHEYYHERYDDTCTIFNRIKIEDELIKLIKELRSRNLIPDKNNKFLSIIIDKYNNR